MSDALSFAELTRQQVELLPVRTVLSMFSHVLDGGQGSNGLDGWGGISVLGVPLGNSSSTGIGGAGGSANGGAS